MHKLHMRACTRHRMMHQNHLHTHARQHMHHDSRTGKRKRQQQQQTMGRQWPAGDSGERSYVNNGWNSSASRQSSDESGGSSD